MYCHICGTKNDNESKFCSNCGESINHIIESKNTFDSKVDSKNDCSDCVCRGIILTNLITLGKKFNVATNQVKEIIEQYISTLEQYGIHYTLIDASDYRYSNPDVSSAHRCVTLGLKDNWLDYSRILTDYYLFGADICASKPKYLFIIGSDDVVPSPVIEHYHYRDVWKKMSSAQRAAVNPNDKDIETDIPYSYLLGEKTFDLLNNKEIFKYEPYFHVGRLPLAADSNIATLLNYFQRVITVTDAGGITVNMSYGQSAFTWRSISALVSGALTFPNYGENIDEDICFSNIFTSPYISLENIDKVFNPNADLFYFNMHGSDAPTSNNFYGDKGVRGFSPFQIIRAENFNVLVTEACYGAKNNNLSTEHSMLLSAISSNTMIYLGSSRIAWGATDSWVKECIDNGSNYSYIASNLGSADLLCKEFIRAICAGIPAGDALYFARKVYIMNRTTLGAIDAATLTEFNLFGEPTMLAYDANCNHKSKKYSSEKIEPMIGNDVKLKCKTDICYTADNDSILNKVRGLVDKNMVEIREKMNKYLYSNYNIEPRSLSFVVKNRYETGVEEYEFYYSAQKGDDSGDHVAITDTEGNLKSIFSTKRVV